MVKHIVFFKLNQNSQENKKRVKQKLLTMENKIPTLKSIEVGINFSKEDRAYDIALLTDFETKDDLDKYATHPYHLEIVSYIKSIAHSSKIVDFIY